MKKKLIFASLLLLTVFSFGRMIRPGIYSMQDFHYFRLVEFDKCIKDLQIPCRWSSDAGLGYGEPLFNFYSAGAYVVGEVFHLVGFALTDSLKLAFIFSLIASAVSMYFLAKKLWKSDSAALISSILYLYAPYRAVDVWVRGALPEAMAFVLFPLILLTFENWLTKPKRKRLLLFSLTLSLLVLTHNLSVILFLPMLLIWIPYRLYSKKLKLIPQLGIAAFFALLLCAFYILPVIFESRYIDIYSTTEGYFGFRGHFVTINQLLFSRYWGYGGSVFGLEDGLSVSVGLVQWVLPIATLAAIVVTKKLSKYKEVLVLFAIGWGYLFLAHSFSTPIWVSIDFMKFIQFPWRFLGPAVFAFSLGAGVLVKLFDGQKLLITSLIIAAAILLNANFFREDIWYDLSDSDLTTGARWEEQTRASIGDYWPTSAGQIPPKFAPTQTADYELISKSSNQYVFEILSDKKNVDYPVNDFPGWSSHKTDYKVIFNFANTPIRTLGNIISVVSLGLVGFLIYAK